MENSLKQRIIGAVVLAALAIIFLPAILKEKTSNGTFESQIPDKPEALKTYRVDTQKVDSLIKESDLKRREIEKQKPELSISEINNPELNSSDLELSKQINSDITVDSSVNKDEQPKAVTQAGKSEVASQEEELANTETKPTSDDKKTTIGEKFTDAAWVVQVASFSNESNAIKMVDKLKKGSYKAYRRKITTNKRVVFRVFVGPYIEKHKAKASLTEISKLSQSDAVIRPFDPIKH